MDRKWWTLIAVCLGTFMLLLDVTIVNVALPDIQTSLKASFSDLQWVVDAYALMLAALLLTTGSLADLFGRRRVFVIGLAIFSVSSLLSGLATTPLFLNLARGAQGVGGAAMFSTSLALLGSSFQGRERGTAFGAWGAITGLAVAVGPVVGGALTTGLSWRWIFLVNVPIGVIAVVMTLARVQESKPPRAQRPDVIGVITFSGALGALIYALIKGNTKGWGSPVILGCLIGAAVLMTAFVIAERVQRERAMFDLSLFRKPTFTGGAIAAFALSAGLFAVLLYITLYLQDVLGYSALQTGLRMLVLSGGILLTSTLSGRLTASVPIRFLIAPGLAMVGAGLLLMRGLDASSGWTHLIPGFIIAGAGTGMINPPLASTAIGVVTPDRAGMASGINSTFRQIGIATGIAGLGSLFSHTVRTHIVALLSHAPHLTASQAHALASGVAQGGGARTGLSALAPQARPVVEHAVRAGFTVGLNDVFLVGAVLALVSSALTLVLIRSRDFESSAARGGAQPPSPRASESAPDEGHQDGPLPSWAQAPRTATAAEGELERAAQVLHAAEEASRSYSRQIEIEIERHRSQELAAAEAQARELLAAAHARSEEYEVGLRRQAREFLEERDRLTQELREHLTSVSDHVAQATQTSQELSRLIETAGGLDSVGGGLDSAGPHLAETNGDAGDLAGSRLGPRAD
ncbi:MAG: MFS transporter [Actinomycetota bacterium]|nr:MFS transporter [Actinomycetota bacterium]